MMGAKQHQFLGWIIWHQSINGVCDVIGLNLFSCYLLNGTDVILCLIVMDVTAVCQTHITPTHAIFGAVSVSVSVESTRA